MTRLLRLLSSLAWAVLAPSLAFAASSSAFEYFHGGYGHYFMTAAPLEIAALDSGQFAGWARTGESFDVLALNEAASAKVCRFWSGQTFAPKSSHFYTPFDWECAIAKGYPAWTFEGEVFAIKLPDLFGACAGGTIPLYRLYNDGKGNAPNHRYTTRMAVREEMIAQGWIAEGRGIGVIGCVPVHTPASVSVESPTLSPWVGESVQLTAMGRDASGAVIPGTTATWSSSNPAVAAISTTGVLQGVTKGSVEVTATINGVAGTQSLTVAPMPRIGVTVGAAKEVVFNYTNDHCSELDTPDQPARFVRTEDGSLVLIDGNPPRIWMSRGADFNSLRRDCRQSALISAMRPTAELYENFEWLWSVYREGNRWHALIHNEFHDPISSTCQRGTCTYNSIAYAVSTDGAQSFSKPTPPAHVVAPAPNVWVPPSSPLADSQWVLEGYFDPTNIVRANDGHYYALMTTIPSKYWWDSPSPYGLCTFRTDNLDDPASWRAWDGSGFNLHMMSPYVTGSPARACTLFFEPIRDSGHMVYSTYLNRYIHVAPSATDIGGRKVCGFYFALSADLLHWSEQQLLIEAKANYCVSDSPGPGMLEPVPVQYPSIVDHADTTVNFERAGRTPYLYYSRFRSVDNGPLYWVDRDLVRVPLTFTRID
jgi:hypothetical protein